MNTILITALLLIDPQAYYSGIPTSAYYSGTVQTPKRLPVVDVYAPSWCAACPSKIAELRRLTGFDWQVHTEFNTYPAWAAREGVSYPVLSWRTSNGAWLHIGDYSSPENFITRWETAERQQASQSSTGQVDAPTPGREVERVIGLLPKPEIGFVDWGCGDARWCIAAAERWGCKVTGIEIDPIRAAIAKERVRALGLEHLITIIEGDATRVEVQADVGVAYLYSNVLEQLRPRIEKLKAFASYMHRPPGLPVVKNGDTWIYTKPTAVQFQQQFQYPTAVWGGYSYSQPVCNSPNCAMCNAIRRQLNSRSR